MGNVQIYRTCRHHRELFNVPTYEMIRENKKKTVYFDLFALMEACGGIDQMKIKWI